jgi:hypothetical protein
MISLERLDTVNGKLRIMPDRYRDGYCFGIQMANDPTMKFTGGFRTREDASFFGHQEFRRLVREMKKTTRFKRRKPR